MRRSGVGVIGVGFIGEIHARSLYELGFSELVAVADVDRERVQDIAGRFGADPYTSYHDLLRRRDVEAVVISTPDHLHVNPAIAAAKAGKHMLVEKPLATDPDEARRIIKEAERAGVRLMVGHSLRFVASYAHAHSVLESGEIGEIVHIWARRNIRVDRARRLKGRVSAIFYLAVHDIDFMRWCLNSEVEHVYSVAKRGVLAEIGVDDSILTVLRFRCGTIGALENCWVLTESFGSMMDRKMEIVGTEGLINIDPSRSTLNIWDEKGFHSVNPQVLHGRLVGSIKEEDRHFIECIQEDKEFLISGNDGLAAVEVASAIHESIREGKVVSL